MAKAPEGIVVNPLDKKSLKKVKTAKKQNIHVNKQFINIKVWRRAGSNHVTKALWKAGVNRLSCSILISIAAIAKCTFSVCFAKVFKSFSEVVIFCCFREHNSRKEQQSNKGKIKRFHCEKQK